jgi:hypothetical protein
MTDPEESEIPEKWPFGKNLVHVARYLEAKAHRC